MKDDYELIITKAKRALKLIKSVNNKFDRLIEGGGGAISTEGM